MYEHVIRNFSYFSYSNNPLKYERPSWKTIERLSEYRRTLHRCLDEGKTHIFSHELAGMHNITRWQVRRDIMFIGYASQGEKGMISRRWLGLSPASWIPPTCWIWLWWVMATLAKPSPRTWWTTSQTTNCCGLWHRSEEDRCFTSVVECYSVDRLRE